MWLAAMLLLSFAFLAGMGSMSGQDSRHVNEPKIPPSCALLVARLSAKGWTLSEQDESKLDTARIQQAMDHCEPGHTVELRSDGDRNAFLTVPLNLRQGM
jgi:polygalacturonase